MSIGVSASTINDTTRSAVVRKLFSQCPVCRKSLGKHSYGKLASAIIDTNNEGRLARYIENRQWGNAAEINDWEYDKNIREYHVIRCPNDIRLGMITVVFTYEILSSDFVENTNIVPEQDSGEILALVGNRWIEL